MLPRIVKGRYDERLSFVLLKFSLLAYAASVFLSIFQFDILCVFTC